MSDNRVETKDRFPLLRRILRAIGLPDEAINDIVERILDWLSTKDQTSGTPTELPFKLRDDFLSNGEISFARSCEAWLTTGQSSAQK
jgi:hypothetical protein